MFWRRIPLRLIRAVVDEALDVLSVEFEGLYARVGRPSVRPEELISALLLQGFFSIRSECELMEHLDYNLIFPGYVGLAVEASVWDATRSRKHRDRLLEAELPRKLLSAVLSQPRVAALMSGDHFPVDGTLIQAWASQKSFKLKNAASTDDGPTGESPDKQSPLRRNSTRSRTFAVRSKAARPMPTPPTSMLGERANPTIPPSSWLMLDMC